MSNQYQITLKKTVTKTVMVEAESENEALHEAAKAEENKDWEPTEICEFQPQASKRVKARCKSCWHWILNDEPASLVIQDPFRLMMHERCKDAYAKSNAAGTLTFEPA